MTNPENTDSTDSLELARTQYQAGKAAFERGQYRQSVEYLEQAVELTGRNSALGGEIQISLITAYQAAGQSAEAIALGEELNRHPDIRVRKQSRRLVYILKAPKLKTRPEWLTQIPDLANLEGADRDNQLATRYGAVSTKSSPRPTSEPEPVDLSQVDTKDNSFIWIALVAIALVLAGLVWLS